MTTPTCVWAGTGNDTLSTGANNDTLRAGGGDDTLIALGGNNNKLFAGTGYTNIWETYSATTDNYYYASTGTLTTHFFSSFLNTSDISLDGAPIADPGITNTTIPFSGGYENFSAYPLFSGAGPQISDVNQQHIGDCYFMSALAAISNVDPQQIRNNITALGDGTYAIEFFENGTPTFVRVNADLPVDDNQLFGANLGNDYSIWVPLMEKGFVYFDSIEKGESPDYGVIDKGGDADPAFDLLTGNTAQGTYNVLNNTDNLSMFGGSATTFAGWINWELQKGDAVEMGVYNGNSNDEESIPGVLVNDHMYTVVADTLNSSGQITGFWLRNPWGFDLQNSQDNEVMAKSGHNDGSDDGMVWVNVAQAWSVVDDIGAVAV
jgi:calpain family cysteine protease/hemolysin type calcium-binding protein